MNSRLVNFAPVGTLVKQPRLIRPHVRKDTSERDPDYLALVRMLPCCAKGCRTEPCHAHHVRISSAAHGTKILMGHKPPDRQCLPLCKKHHKELHSKGEKVFWQRLNISPVQLCVELYKQRHSLDAMRLVILEARR